MTDVHLKDCPFCGATPPKDLSDTLYPSGTWWRINDGYRHYVAHRDREPGDNMCWQVICNEVYGGCGAEISADSEQEAIDKWNHRDTWFKRTWRKLCRLLKRRKV
jgi:hypothetical protein